MALVQSQVGRTWFQSERDFTAGFDALNRALTAPLRRRDFHRRLAPLVAALGHGHVTLERPVPSLRYCTRFLDSTAHYLPYALQIADRHVYITADLSSASPFSPGTELLTVDGVPTAALIDSIEHYLSADGRNTSFKRFQLGTDFRFHEWLDLIYGPRVTRMATVRRTNGATASRVVGFTTPREMMTRHVLRTGRAIDTFPPAVALTMLQPRAALLTVFSFWDGLLPKAQGTFETALTTAFRTIGDSGVTDLVIDVWRNEGGAGNYPPLLYSFVASRPFDFYGRTIVASDSLSWLQYAPDASEDLKAFAVTPQDFIERTADGLWQLKRKPDETSLTAPRTDAYSGRLFVLTDGGSFSAANVFVQGVATAWALGGRPAVFVGKENGGDSEAGKVSGGVQQTLTLPHSGERLTLALTTVVPRLGSVPVALAPVPDVRVLPNGLDIAAGGDPVLERVRVMIDATRQADARATRQRGVSPRR